MIKSISTDNSHKDVVITGDFNHRDIIWNDENNNISTTNPTDAKFVECIDDSYLHQLISKPTRYPKQECHKLSVLDLVLTNDQNLLSSP